MDSDRKKVNIGADSAEGVYTLESILSEYKGNAYIQGEKRLSRDELERQVQSILSELSGELAKKPDTTELPPAAPKAPETEKMADMSAPEMKAKTQTDTSQRAPKTPSSPVKVPSASSKKPQSASKPDVASPYGSDEEVKEYIPGKAKKNPTPVDINKEPTKPAPERKPRAGEVVKAEKKDTPEKSKKSDYKSEKDYEKRRERMAQLELQRQIIREREQKKQELEASYLTMDDDEQAFFGVGKYARKNAVDDESENVEAAIAREAERRQRREERRAALGKQSKSSAKTSDKNEASEEPEMSARDAIMLYGNGIVSLTRRCAAALIFCLVMAYFLLAPEIGISLPHAFSDIKTFALFLLSLELVVMLLGVDIFITGLIDILRLRFGGESLAATACIASIIDALFIVINEGAIGLPYCAIAAFSMLFSMWGTRLSKTAYNKTFKNAMISSSPIVVSAEWEKTDEGIVLTKKRAELKGFIKKSSEIDLCERVYARLSPMLIIGSLVFSLLSSVFKGRGEDFMHCFAAMTAASASFSSLLAFNLPFSSIVKHLTGSGAALAGWSGVCDINDAIGIVIKDTDLFPENAISLGGVKVYSDYNDAKVVSYAGSLILASGSGLTHIFTDLLKEYACSLCRVEEFSCYEGGGIGAFIEGDRVLAGSSAFMNLMSVRLPNNLNLKNAVFIAINEELAGVFIINYTPAKTVQNALITLIRSKITPLFAVRDFNITPSMIKNKFKISTDEIEFMTFEARYKLSASQENTEIKPAAVMSREGLSHFVEIVRCGQNLSSTVKASVIVSALGSAVGLLMMFFICFNGAYVSGSASNVLIFMLLWLVPVYILNRIGARY